MIICWTWIYECSHGRGISIVVIASIIKLSYIQMKLSSPVAAAISTSHQRDPYILYFIDYNFLIFLYAHNRSSLAKQCL